MASEGSGEVESGKQAPSSLGIERTNGFSDAVFAVAITLLILTITVPVVSDISQLPSELEALWPKFVGFVISFAIIGAFWLSHHVIFACLSRLKPGLIWLNLLFLMFIVLLPFTTDLMSEYGESLVAMAFYDLNMAAASLSLCLLWWYASYWQGLTREDLDQATRKHILLNYLSMSIIFLLSLGIAFVNVSFSQYFFLLLIPSNIFLGHLHKRDLVKAVNE